MKKLHKKNLTRIASFASLSIALALVSIKIWACLATGSIALLTSAADGFVDVLESVVTLAGVYYAQRPADDSHRYGHGKAEAVAAFVQALLLAGAGITLCFESINRFINPQILSSQKLGISIIIGSTLCATMLVMMQTLVVKYTHSIAIAADRAHYVTDIAINIAVLCALLLENQLGWTRADAFGAFSISCYMIWNARNMIQSTLLQLLDHELNIFERKRIIKTMQKCFGVKKIQELRTRNSGDKVFIESRISVDGKLNIITGHNICSNIEKKVKELFSSADVFIHLEPEQHYRKNQKQKK
ncbi:Cation-efflux pump FieF [Candidatus Westeberhardia cardiocondylae]|uniref:Cation-efflux pump FieF n=1 Tax=Candidatus Westeberhardia cardiocondylae TaxID=1594731 RepID=A0A0H5BWW6_9ENTR|nr:cation diffusion facilitator family transporter [Candidatus Westeberhardia cardiocondylae]MCR3756306.1 Zn(2(+))/Fe(2(+))/Cd(2(+)) exporter [Candidatus Westeberhardia cardiocondylae]CEN32207.1 Cation-efflux pump FieF [Candidatus Westeberhardia cardiocondylae]